MKQQDREYFYYKYRELQLQLSFIFKELVVNNTFATYDGGC